MLWPTLLPEPDESSTSFASRLALLHGRTAVQFCQDLRIGFQALVDGRDEALARLAGLTGAPVDLLRLNAIVRTGPWTYGWRGQELGRDNLNRYTLQVCPRCLAQDVALTARGRGHGPYGRAVWLLRYIRTCPDHHVALVPVHCTWRTVHDFARAIGPLVTRIREGAVAAEGRIPSRLETFLLDRLAGRPRPDAAWLGRLGFAAAADTCEVLGAILAFGKTVLLRGLGPSAWHAAGDMGFVVAQAGPAGIGEALRACDAGLAEDRASCRVPVSIYGAFHTFLSRNRERRPDLDPVRAVVSDHILRRAPAAPGTKVLGRCVEDRTVHSIRSAARDYGLDARLVRGLLRKAGAIGEGSDASSTDAVLFDARAHGPMLEEFARSVPEAVVAAHLNARVGQTWAMLRAGLVPALAQGASVSGPHARRYSAAALDGFLTDLAARAEEVVAPGPDDCGIPDAAAHAGCGPAAIVRAVLGGTLPWVGRLSGARGFAACLVRLRDVRSLVQADVAREWSLNEIATELSLDHGTLVGLVGEGILPARRFGYGGGRTQRRVSEACLRTFLDDYVWLSQLGREWGRDPRLCRKALTSMGIHPAAEAKTIGTDFFRRCDLPASPSRALGRSAGRPQRRGPRPRHDVE